MHGYGQSESAETSNQILIRNVRSTLSNELTTKGLRVLECQVDPLGGVAYWLRCMTLNKPDINPSFFPRRGGRCLTRVDTLAEWLHQFGDSYSNSLASSSAEGPSHVTNKF
jgi:hypothetical protein